MEEEFEVPGAHEHEMEHAAEHRLPLAQEVAVFSAVLATLGAIVSFLGGHTQNEALYYKNEAVLMKARASDDWAYYQAESTKRHIASLEARLAPGFSTDAGEEAKRYGAEQVSLRREAQRLDRASDEADLESRHALAPHTKLALSMTFLQIAIALASITALTRKRWLLWAAAAFALAGATLGTIAWF